MRRRGQAHTVKLKHGQSNVARRSDAYRLSGGAAQACLASRDPNTRTVTIIISLLLLDRASGKARSRAARYAITSLDEQWAIITSAAGCYASHVVPLPSSSGGSSIGINTSNHQTQEVEFIPDSRSRTDSIHLCIISSFGAQTNFHPQTSIALDFIHCASSHVNDDCHQHASIDCRSLPSPS